MISDIIDETQHKAPSRPSTAVNEFMSGRKSIIDKYGFNDKQIPKFVKNHRALAAISEDIEDINATGQSSRLGKTAPPMGRHKLTRHVNIIRNGLIPDIDSARARAAKNGNGSDRHRRRNPPDDRATLGDIVHVKVKKKKPPKPEPELEPEPKTDVIAIIDKYRIKQDDIFVLIGSEWVTTKDICKTIIKSRNIKEEFRSVVENRIKDAIKRLRFSGKVEIWKVHARLFKYAELGTAIPDASEKAVIVSKRSPKTHQKIRNAFTEEVILAQMSDKWKSSKQIASELIKIHKTPSKNRINGTKRITNIISHLSADNRIAVWKERPRRFMYAELGTEIPELSEKSIKPAKPAKTTRTVGRPRKVSAMSIKSKKRFTQKDMLIKFVELTSSFGAGILFDLKSEKDGSITIIAKIPPDATEES
jgi:hypothetical protein